MNGVYLMSVIKGNIHGSIRVVVILYHAIIMLFSNFWHISFTFPSSKFLAILVHPNLDHFFLDAYQLHSTTLLTAASLYHLQYSPSAPCGREMSFSL